MCALKSVESICFQSEADSAHNDYDIQSPNCMRNFFMIYTENCRFTEYMYVSFPTQFRST